MLFRLSGNNVHLKMGTLPTAATAGHRLPGIHRPLFSVATAVDAGMSAHFYSTHCTFEKDGEVLVQGWRDHRSRLWECPLHFDTKEEMLAIFAQQAMQATNAHYAHTINSIYDCENAEQLIKFYHAAAFSPATSDVPIHRCSNLTRNESRCWIYIIRIYTYIIVELLLEKIDNCTAGAGRSWLVDS